MTEPEKISAYTRALEILSSLGVQVNQEDQEDLDALVPEGFDQLEKLASGHRSRDNQDGLQE